MIREWLLKHRLVNELGKTIVAGYFGFISYASWEGGKLASYEIAPTDSYKLMVFGIGTGIIGILALSIFIDVLYSIIRIIKKRNNILGVASVASSKEGR